MHWPFSFSKPTLARKYVDLIHIQSGKFPNVDPGCLINPGDFGTIDEWTGKFEKQGSILSGQPEITKTTVDSRDIFVKDGVALDFDSIKSFGVVKQDYNAKPSVKVAEVAEASFEANFQFGKKRAAALVMHKANTYTLQNFDSILATGSYSYLKDKCLVWEVVRCSSFTSYLSAKASEQIKVSFGVDAPIAAAAGVTVGASAGGRWSIVSAGGEEKIGNERPGVMYTTLFRARTIGKKKYDLRSLDDPPLEEQKKDRWLDTEVPWKSLDDDGVEEENQANYYSTDEDEE